MAQTSVHHRKLKKSLTCIPKVLLSSDCAASSNAQVHVRGLLGWTQERQHRLSAGLAGCSAPCRPRVHISFGVSTVTSPDLGTPWSRRKGEKAQIRNRAGQTPALVSGTAPLNIDPLQSSLSQTLKINVKKRDMRKLWGVMDISTVLIMVMVSWLFTYIKTLHWKL